ncbi:MAG: CARDB domain-containing protein [Sedimenticola sp.]
MTLENRGGAGVPASAYDRSNSAGIQLYKDGKGWQGVALFGFDRTRALMKPGGQASFTLFQPLPEGTSVRVKIVADLRNQIRESNKRNNTLELELRCR